MTSDPLSPSDGTQPPEASVEPFDAGPAPEPPLAGFDLPRLPELPPLPDLSALVQAPAAAQAEADAMTPAQAHAHTTAGGEQPEDEVPTPPQWPAISTADASAAYSMPDAPPVAPPVAFHMSAQPPTRPARPRVRDSEPSLLGLTRRSRTRVGQLALKWVFVVIFVVILLQMIISLLTTR